MPRPKKVQPTEVVRSAEKVEKVVKKVEEKVSSKIRLFGKVDINKQGKIGSSVPAWSMTTHLENLEEETASKRRQLERGQILPDRIMEVRAEIEREEKRIQDIKDSKPKLNERQENELWAHYKSLGKDIGNAMFSRDDMKLGLANSHEEARRVSQPVMKVDERVADFCSANNIPVTEKRDGLHITRKGAELAYKYIGRYFNENSNTERLRKNK